MKWNDIIDGYDDTKLNINTDKGPNHTEYSMVSLLLFILTFNGYFVHLNLNVEIASTIWLIFSIASL